MDDYKIIFSGTGGGRIVLSNQLRSTAGIILKLNETRQFDVKNKTIFIGKQR